MRRTATFLGLGLLIQAGATGQTNRHNNLGQEEHLWKMKKIATHEFIAVGNSGSVVKYNDSCNDWLPLPAGTASDDFRNMSFPVASTGYISGPANAFYKTTNGGASWTSIPASVTGLTNGSIQCVYFKDANSGFIAGSQIGVTGGGRFIKKTTDGGATWITVTPATISTSTVYDMAFFNASTGIAVATNNKAFRTTDNGDTWTAVTTPGTAYSVALAGSNVAVAVANGTIMRSADQGLTWTTVATTASGLQGVHFYDAQHGMITGSAGALLYTTDAGLTWTAVPTLLSTKLYDVQMTGPAKAVAVGANGIAIDIDLAQPFHRLFEEHFCHPSDSVTYTRYTNTDNSGATPPRKWFFTNVNEAENGLIAAQWFPGNFAIYDAYYYEDIQLQHHSDSAVIETRSIDLTGVTQLSLDWNEAFYTHPDGLSKTKVEGFNGAAWIKLYESNGVDFGDGVASAVFPSYKRAIDISALAGVANSKLRFTYTAPNTNDGLKNFWAVSDIVISNKTTAVQLNDLVSATSSNECLPITPQDLEVTVENTGMMTVFPLELGWSSSDGQSGVAADYSALDAASSVTVTLADDFTPPAAGGAVTIKAWIRKLPNLVAANDTVTRTFYFVPDPSGTALLGNDTSICPGGALLLQAPATLGAHTWSDGSTGNTLQVSTAGTYWLSALTGTCSVSDTVQVTVMDVAAPVITQQGSQLKTTEGYASYEWLFNNTVIPDATTHEITVTQNGTYTVRVTTNAGCGAISSPYAYTGNGTGLTSHDRQQDGFTIYPNPAGATVSITMATVVKGAVQVSISDVSGRIVSEHTASFDGKAMTLDVHSLASGVYIIRLQGGTLNLQAKLIKQ